VAYLFFINLILHVEIYRRNFPGKLFKGVDIVWEIFPGGNFHRRDSLLGNFTREKLSMDTLEGENFQEIFPTEGGFPA